MDAPDSPPPPTSLFYELPRVSLRDAGRVFALQSKQLNELRLKQPTPPRNATAQQFEKEEKDTFGFLDYGSPPPAQSSSSGSSTSTASTGSSWTSSSSSALSSRRGPVHSRRVSQGRMLRTNSGTMQPLSEKQDEETAAVTKSRLSRHLSRLSGNDEDNESESTVVSVSSTPVLRGSEDQPASLETGQSRDGAKKETVGEKKIPLEELPDHVRRHLAKLDMADKDDGEEEVLSERSVRVLPVLPASIPRGLRPTRF